MRTITVPPQIKGSLVELRAGHAEIPRGRSIEVADNEILRLDCDSVIRGGSLDAFARDAIQSVRLLSPKTDDESVQAVVEAFPSLLQFHVPRAPRVSDAACGLLQRARRLRSINVGFARITDAGAAKIGALTELMRVSLDNAQLTDAGLGSLGELPELAHLALDGNINILGPGLAALADHKNLRFLFLNGTKVGDEHIAHLSGCTSLMRVMLSSTNVTEQCVLTLPRNEACEVFLPNGLDGEKLDEVRRQRPELVINGVRGTDLRDLPTGTASTDAELPVALRSNSPTLALFTADWCQPCQWVKTAIDTVPIQLRERFRYVEIDIEADPDTPATMRVQSLPTLLFLTEGREHSRLIGAHKADSIAERMRAVLA